MLMIAFLPFSCLGSWMYDEPPVGSYSARSISRSTTLWNLQLLPLWLKLKIPYSIGSKNILNSSASSLPSRFTAVLVRKCAIIVSVFPLIKPCLTISQFKINLILFSDFLSSAQDERFRSLQEIPGAKTLFFARNCKMSRCTFKCTGRLHNLKSRAVSFHLFDFFFRSTSSGFNFFYFW